MTVGGWFDAEDLFGALNTYKAIEKNSPGAQQHAGHGPVVHGGWSRSDGDLLGQRRTSAPRPPSSTATRSSSRSSIHWLKGKGDPKLPEAYVFETGTNQWRREDAWPPKDARRRRSTCTPTASSASTPPDESRRAFDEYVSDPNKPVPYIGGQAHGHDPRAHGRRPALRLHAPRRARLTRPTRSTEDVTLAGPLTPSLFVSTTRHRFRLGREADRRLSRRLSRSRPEPDRHPHGRLSAAGPRRDLPRQIPQQLLEARAVHAGQDGEDRIRDARHRPLASATAIASWCRSRAPGSRWPTAIRRSSWISTARSRPDFVKATQRVYHTAAMPSQVKVLVRQP